MLFYFVIWILNATEYISHLNININFNIFIKVNNLNLFPQYTTAKHSNGIFLHALMNSLCGIDTARRSLDALRYASTQYRVMKWWSANQLNQILNEEQQAEAKVLANHSKWDLVD